MTVAAQPLKIKIKIRQLTKDRIFLTYPSETNQVLELSPVYKILTINATLDCEFFSFCKQTASPEPTICHAAV